MGRELVTTLDIGASKIRGQVFDFSGSCAPIHAVKLTDKQLNNSSFMELVFECIGRANQVATPDDKILAVSIGSPGPLDPFRGIIEEAPNLGGVKNLSITEGVGKKFGLPVFLLNDADAAGLGECWMGAGRGCDSSAVYITLSSGVGSTFLINGELQRGLGKAPELGHIPLAIENNLRHCSCGNWGCSEAYLGTAGLAVTYADIFGVKIAGLGLEERHSISLRMREGIKANDSRWIKVRDVYAGHLAFFLRNVVLIYQPEVIILGGGIIYGNDPLLKAALDRLNAIDDKMMVMKKGVTVKLAKFGNAVNLGAAKNPIDHRGDFK